MTVFGIETCLTLTAKAQKSINFEQPLVELMAFSLIKWNICGLEICKLWVSSNKLGKEKIKWKLKNAGNKFFYEFKTQVNLCWIPDNSFHFPFNPLSANFTKWPNTHKQFVGNLPTNCFSVFGHFTGLALKGLRNS